MAAWQTYAHPLRAAADSRHPLQSQIVQQPVGGVVRAVRLAARGQRASGCAVQKGTPDRLARLEAVLYMARQPLTTRKLAELANLEDGTEARTLLGQLQRNYDARGAGFQVVRVAGGYRMYTRAQFARWLGALTDNSELPQLSPPAMEVLAIVAYRQPVLRAEVEAIRGVQCGELLRQLMERDLLRIVGRSEDLGRPFLYGTTRYFLQVFGLHNLDELPNVDQRDTVPPQASAA